MRYVPELGWYESDHFVAWPDPVFASPDPDVPSGAFLFYERPIPAGTDPVAVAFPNRQADLGEHTAWLAPIRRRFELLEEKREKQDGRLQKIADNR